MNDGKRDKMNSSHADVDEKRCMIKFRVYQLLLAYDHVSIWSPQCHCFRQWNPIFQYHVYWLLQGSGYAYKVCTCGTYTRKQTRRVNEQSNPQRTHEESGRYKRVVSEMLHEILWSYHTIPQATTKESPFSMV